jgi:plasmid stabilization system protein ParE
MRIIWSEHSLLDLRSIRDYISLSNPINADNFVIELFDTAELMLNTFPKSGRKIPEINKEQYREIIHGNYRIMYNIHNEEIQILTVRNSNQSFSSTEII